MDIEIRSANASDITEIIKLNDVIQRQHFDPYPETFRYPLNEEHIHTHFSKILDNKQHSFVLAYSNNIPVGYLWYELQEPFGGPFRHPASCMYVHHIFVQSDQRKHGIANKLFDHLNSQAIDNGNLQIKLSAWEKNTGAHAFFKTQGFETFCLLMRKMPTEN